jgi:hypothetical protein
MFKWLAALFRMAKDMGIPAREDAPAKARVQPVNDPNGNVVKLVTKARRRKVGKDVTRLDEQ